MDFDPERGYSTPDDAFMPITSIAVHLQWLETLVCFAVPPKTLTWEQAQEEIKEFLLSASLPIQYSWFGELCDVTKYPYD